MCGSCAALPGGNRLVGQSWPEGTRAAFLRRRLRWMDFVAHSHYLWIASGCILWLFWYTSDGLRRGEQWIALTYACKAVIGQRLIFCVWGLRPKFNSSASTSSLYTAGNGGSGSGSGNHSSRASGGGSHHACQPCATVHLVKVNTEHRGSGGRGAPAPLPRVRAGGPYQTVLILTLLNVRRPTAAPTPLVKYQ